MFGARPIGRAGIEIVWPPSSTLTSPARSCSWGITAALPSGNSRARSSLAPTAISTPPITESAAVSARILRPLVIRPSWASCLLASPAPPMNDWTAVSIAPAARRPAIFVPCRPTSFPANNALATSKVATGTAPFSANSRANAMRPGSCSPSVSACGSVMSMPARWNESKMPLLISIEWLASPTALAYPALAPSNIPFDPPRSAPAPVHRTIGARPLLAICRANPAMDSPISSPKTPTGL